MSAGSTVMGVPIVLLFIQSGFPPVFAFSFSNAGCSQYLFLLSTPDINLTEDGYLQQLLLSAKDHYLSYSSHLSLVHSLAHFDPPPSTPPCVVCLNPRCKKDPRCNKDRLLHNFLSATKCLLLCVSFATHGCSFK